MRTFGKNAESFCALLVKVQRVLRTFGKSAKIEVKILPVIFTPQMQTSPQLVPLTPAWKDAVYHEHQEHGINWMLQAEELGYTIPDTDHVVRGGILGDKMGVGKTIQSLGLIANSPAEKTLIITPLAVRGQWESELRRADVNLYLPTPNGGQWRAQEPIIAGRKAVYLVHYDKVASRSELCNGKDYTRIILDEAHTIRNASTRKAEAVFQTSTRSVHGAEAHLGKEGWSGVK